jgi:bifunctional UDP-N-acetylglucosamine pyrophosphorylase/glucosamine-1-phosphate N-acetyltransferase
MPAPQEQLMPQSASPAAFAIVILAAGKGTRLKSRLPKVLHCVGGQALLEHGIAAAAKVSPVRDIFAVIGHQAELVQKTVEHTGINFVLQADQRGTGHAIMTARPALVHYSFFLVLSGDAPLLRPGTIERLRDFHLQSGSAMTILTAEPPDPAGYGRIVRTAGQGGAADLVSAIVEDSALSASQQNLREINSGIYAFSCRPLFAHLDKLTTGNAHQEFYLTDMAAILNQAGEKVSALPVSDAHEVLGANTRAELAGLDALLRTRKCLELMAGGVTIFRPDTCVMDAGVEIGTDTIIEPFVQLLGRTAVGSDCTISSYSVIRDCRIGNGVTVRPGCMMTEARVEDGAILGPYCHLRPATEIAAGAHVGNFVELKKTRLGKGSKANHLTYLGDAVIGGNVNVGAGTITCNYDGVHKHQTTIEDDAFIGSDSILVAPVTVGSGSYVAAASCITEDVPAGSLALGRARQINKEGWARRKREKDQKEIKDGPGNRP